MKESGCEIPTFLDNIKKPHKKIRKKLETNLPAREDVAPKPHRYKYVTVFGDVFVCCGKNS